MTLRPLSFALLFASLLTTLAAKPLAAQSAASSTPSIATPDRVTSPIVASVRTQTNPVHPLAVAQNDLGRVNSSQVFHRMIMLLQGSDAQKADLTQLLAAQQDSTSSQYHQWLTPQQFGARFGPSQNDVNKVASWLSSQGFTVETSSNGRRFLLFTGTSAQVESAFQTQMHSYKVNGKTQFANATAASIPTALAPVVKGMAALNSFAAVQPTSHKALPPQAPQTIVGGYLLTTPADLTAIYNGNPLKAAGLQGEGQSIALIEQSNINVQDITDFRKITGLPAAKLNIIVNGPDPGLIGDETEAIVDTEFAGAFTPNATINFIVSASTQFNSGIDYSTVYAVDNLVSPITSLSYGGCEALAETYYASEAQLYQLAYEQGAAEGISHFVSSGDEGGDACYGFGFSAGYGVNFLGDTPWNVSVGGTEFNIPDPAIYFPSPSGTATGYIPETAWNDYDNPKDGRPLAGGGGASIIFAKPSWQAGPGVPADGARDLPDVSLVAGDNLAYLLCERDIGANCSQNLVSGEIGTSLASPTWASIQALVNQKNSIISGTGNPNPTYYRLAASAKSPFHDITVGDNKVPDETGQLIGYATTPGYDLATGLGSVDVNALATSWGPPTGAGTTTVTLTTTATHITHGSSLGSTVKVASGTSTAASGDVALLAGTQGVGQITLASGTASLTFGASSGVFLPGGSYNLTARYAGDTNFAPATSNAIALTVDPEPTSTSAGPATQTVYYGTPTSLSAGAFGTNSGSGYAVPGTYTFSDSGKAIGTASIAATGESFAYANYNGSAILTLQGSTSLAAGTHSITAASPVASPSFLASTSTAVKVIVFKEPPLLSLAADHTTPTANSKVTLTAILYPDYYPVPVTGTITFYDGTAMLGTANLTTTEAADGGYVVTFPTQFASGTHYLSAVYGGDANDLTAVAGAVNVTVSAKSATTSTIGGQSFGLAGNNVTIVANVIGDSSSAAPTGTVTFTDSGANSGAGAVVGTATVTAGTATLTTTALTAGKHYIFATYAGDTNFAGSLTQSVTVTVGDFSLAANPTSVNVTAGQTTSAIALAYTGTSSFATFSSGITFACSGLPTGSSCSFSVNPLLPTVGSTGTTSGTVNLTISTAGPTLTKASLQMPEHPGTSSGTRFAVTMAALLAIGLPLAFRRKRLLPTLLAVLMLATLGGGLIGCSGSSTPTYSVSNPGTAAGTSTVTVTATLNGGTYGTLNHTATVSLVVASATGQ